MRDIEEEGGAATRRRRARRHPFTATSGGCEESNAATFDVLPPKSCSRHRARCIRLAPSFASAGRQRSRYTHRAPLCMLGTLGRSAGVLRGGMGFMYQNSPGTASSSASRSARSRFCPSVRRRQPRADEHRRARTLLLSAVSSSSSCCRCGSLRAALLAAGHKPLIARLTGEFVLRLPRCRSCSAQDMAVFPTAQRVVRGPMVVNVITNIVLLLLLPLLILPAPRAAFIGVPIAITLRDHLLHHQLALAVLLRRNRSDGAWPRWRRWRPALTGWGEVLRLGLPGCIMTWRSGLGGRQTLLRARCVPPTRRPTAARAAPVEAFPILSNLMVIPCPLASRRRSRRSSATRWARAAGARGGSRHRRHLVVSLATLAAAALVAGRHHAARSSSATGRPAHLRALARALPPSRGVVLDSIGPSFRTRRLRLGVPLASCRAQRRASGRGDPDRRGDRTRGGLGLLGPWLGLDLGCSCSSAASSPSAAPTGGRRDAAKRARARRSAGWPEGTAGRRSGGGGGGSRPVNCEILL